jgi:hypothetical protein
VSGYLLNIIHCGNTRKVMRAALDAGFEWVGYTKGGHIEIRWPSTGQLLHCATTPSDPNSWKAFAREVHSVSGVEVWRKGNRRRSRKSTRPGTDAQVEASRQRHARRIEAGRAAAEREEAADRRRIAEASRILAADRHRREIEELMRPG